MPAARRAAWDAYVTLTNGLLPVLRTGQAPEAVSTNLGMVATRVLRYAPLWDEQGPMLAAALRSAIRLHRAGERGDLLELLQVVADRLYLLSARRSLPRGGSCDPTIE